MVWGAGRLLWCALSGALRVAGTFLWPLRVRLDRFVASADRRLLRRLGAVAVLLTLFGPGRPFLTLLDDARVPSWDAARVGEAGDADSLNYSAGVDTDSTSSEVALPLGTSVRDRPVATVPSKRRALIVGINRAKGGRPLPGSVTDAKNTRDALLGYGFPASNITMLLDREATRSAILGHMDSLAARTPKDGIAVFAVASHTRRRGGTNELLTADGKRISAYEMASKLRKVRSPMWVALPTCYAGGYAIPGIIGPKRVATFASPKDQPTYQLGEAGSYLIINMVRKGMLEGHAPSSVEDAFRFAKRTLEREHPNRVPTMSDGIAGDLVLGESTFGSPSTQTTFRRPHQQGSTFPSAQTDTSGSATSRAEYDDGDGTAPSPTPAPRRKGNVGVCGKFAYNCRS
jgi:hypothetical protein